MTPGAMRLIVCGWVFLVTLPASAGDAPGSGIGDSPHDFTRVAGIVNAAESPTSRCIFCHFPQNANGVIKSGLIQIGWNENPAQGFYWSKNTMTQGGTRLPTNLSTWIGPSKNCLQCHGGTAVIADSARRKLGDGGELPRWARPADQPGGVARIVAMGRAGHAAGATGDLDGTHPFGIPYPYRGIPGTYNGISTGRSVDVSEYVPMPANVKLFTLSRGHIVQGAAVGETGIECASCHDVHNEDVRGRWLLRDTQAQLCLDCHGK